MEEAMEYRNRLNQIMDIHQDLGLDDRYDGEMSWINLERSDSYQDWTTFKKIYEKSELFNEHIFKTWILNWNILKKVKIDMSKANSWTDYEKLQELGKTRIKEFLSNI